MTYEEKWARLKCMCLSGVLGFSAFMATWMLMCFLANNVLELGADSWRMLFGYIAGSVGLAVWNRIENFIKHDL